MLFIFAYFFLLTTSYIDASIEPNGYVDGIFNRDDLKYGVPPLFNVSASQSDPKNIKLQTVIGSLNYLK